VTPKAFKHWRKGVMRMSQKEAAEALGLKRRVVQYYEKGERDGEPLAIPKAVRLACFALAEGVTDYHGPDTGAEGIVPDPTVGTVPAPDAVTGSKKRRASARRSRRALATLDTGGAESDTTDSPDVASA